MSSPSLQDLNEEAEAREELGPKVRHRLGLAVFVGSFLAGFALAAALVSSAGLGLVLSLCSGLLGAVGGVFAFMRLSKLLGTWPSKIKNRESDDEAPKKSGFLKKLKPKNKAISQETGLCPKSIRHQLKYIYIEIVASGEDLSYAFTYLFLWWKHPKHHPKKKPRPLTSDLPPLSSHTDSPDSAIFLARNGALRVPRTVPQPQTVQSSRSLHTGKKVELLM